MSHRVFFYSETTFEVPPSPLPQGFGREASREDVRGAEWAVCDQQERETKAIWDICSDLRSIIVTFNQARIPSG